jgi:hypothetical protein
MKLPPLLATLLAKTKNAIPPDKTEIPFDAPLLPKSATLPRLSAPFLTAYICNTVGVAAAFGIFLMSWNAAAEIGSTPMEVNLLRFGSALAEIYSFHALYILTLVGDIKRAYLAATIIFSLVMVFTVVEIGTSMTNISAHYSDKIDAKVGISDLTKTMTGLVTAKAKGLASAPDIGTFTSSGEGEAQTTLATAKAERKACSAKKGWKNVTACQRTYDVTIAKASSYIAAYHRQESRSHGAAAETDKTLAQLEKLQAKALAKPKHYFEFVNAFATTEAGRAAMQRKLGLLYIGLWLALAFIPPYLGNTILQKFMAERGKGSEEIEPTPLPETPASPDQLSDSEYARMANAALAMVSNPAFAPPVAGTDRINPIEDSLGEPIIQPYNSVGNTQRQPSIGSQPEPMGTDRIDENETQINREPIGNRSNVCPESMGTDRPFREPIAGTDRISGTDRILMTLTGTDSSMEAVLWESLRMKLVDEEFFPQGIVTLSNICKALKCRKTEAVQWQQRLSAAGLLTPTGRSYQINLAALVKLS